MYIKDYQRVVEVVKSKLKDYLIKCGYHVEGNKVQCPNGKVHANNDTGKISAAFIPGSNNTKVHCFVENRCFDILDVYAIQTGKEARGEMFFVVLKELCDMYGIPYEEVYEHSPKEIENRKKRQALEELHKLSLKNASKGIEYYKKRYMTKEKIMFFKIGYIEPNMITKELNDKFKTLFEYSISKTLSSPGLVIPVYDEFNQYRSIIIRQFSDDTSSKYLNYSIGGKGLYNLNNAKKDDYVYVVEGTFDTMALYPETNVVGVLTNGVKSEDLEFFKKRNFKNIYIALDEDNSKKKKQTDGIYSTIMALRNLEANVFVIELPEDSDPDEIVNEKGIDAFYALKKTPAILYLLKALKDEKITVKEVYEFVAGCPDVILKEKYVNILSKELSVSKRGLSKEIEKFSDTDRNINLIDYAKEKGYTEELLDDFTESAWNRSYDAVKTGFTLFDRYMGGLEDTIYMMIAYPEHGKSLTLLNMTSQLLRDSNNYIAFYSLDDGVKRAILPRLLAIMTGLTPKQIKEPTPDIKDKWENGVAKLRNIKDNFIIKDGADIRSVADFENFLKIHKHIADERGKKFIVIVDNLHCLVSSSKYEATENMQRVAAFLKKVPQMYNCPVFTTAEVPKSADKKPTGKDIKETIDLWYAARCVIGVYNGMRDKGDTNLMWDSGNGIPEPVVEFYISKNQTGESWHGSLFYKVRAKDNVMIECTEDEANIIKNGGMLF